MRAMRVVTSSLLSLWTLCACGQAPPMAPQQPGGMGDPALNDQQPLQTQGIFEDIGKTVGGVVSGAGQVAGDVVGGVGRTLGSAADDVTGAIGRRALEGWRAISNPFGTPDIEGTPLATRQRRTLGKRRPYGRYQPSQRRDWRRYGRYRPGQDVSLNPQPLPPDPPPDLSRRYYGKYRPYRPDYRARYPRGGYYEDGYGYPGGYGDDRGYGGYGVPQGRYDPQGSHWGNYNPHYQSPQNW